MSSKNMKKIDKKIKIYARVSSIQSDGKVILWEINDDTPLSCTTDPSTIDAILGLGKYSKTYFYGTVKKDYFSNAYLHIEYVE